MEREPNERMPFVDEKLHFRQCLLKFVMDDAKWHGEQSMWGIDLSGRPRAPKSSMLWLGAVHNEEKMCDYGITQHFRLVQFMFRGW